MRLPMMALSSWILLTAACVKRPPPIVTPPAAPASEAPPQCTVETGIDTLGHPDCSAGCQWDPAQKQCVPAPAAPPAPAQPAPPPNGV